MLLLYIAPNSNTAAVTPQYASPRQDWHSSTATATVTVWGRKTGGSPFGEQIAQPRHHRQLTTSSTVDRTARVAIPRHHCPPVLTPSSPPNRPLGHTILPAVNAIDSTLQPSPPLRLPQSLSPPSAVLSLLLPPLGLPAHRLATMLATSDTLTAISVAALCPSSPWSVPAIPPLDPSPFFLTAPQSLLISYR